ncbi:extracellular solute-binding protein [Streptomyces sp. Ag109_G2-15]|uniref:extracellular solute-binding protein n=1 Tax=Streptomyces sp. Ag109_G2-15 TaxID=1938850 RepID=UPI000BE3D057|nr:extracellular solute-binding protein [Streptomyces sp. Ag109_G2-15]
MSLEMNRRAVLRTAAGVAGAASLSPLLAACGGSGSGAGKGGTSSKKGLAAALPAYVPSTVGKPDIASVRFPNGAVTEPGYLTFPAEPVTTVKKTPGKGGHFTSATPLWGAIPPVGNQYYEAMSKALGTTIKMQPANGNTYGQSLATLSASGDLPDWVQIPTWLNGQAQTGGLVGRHLADLTPYLSGDKVKEYPNLAAIPSSGWMAGAWENKLYGIPCFTSGTAFNQVVFYRQDVFEDHGIDAADIKSADDLMRAGRELTDAKAGRWAFDDIWTYFNCAFGVPQKFRVDGGKLVHKYQTPEILEALAWHHKLAKSGLMNPDALAGNVNDSKTRFYAGKTLIMGDGMGAWGVGDAQSGQAANKNYRRGLLPVFAADGHSKPYVYIGAGTGYVSYLNARLKPSQIRELLSVANYLAAPWGSAEYTMTIYGVKGVDYNLVKGVPVATPAGQKNVQQATYPFLAACPNTVNNPGYPEITKEQCAWLRATAPFAVKPVFWNLNVTVPARYNAADTAQAVEDTITSVIHGLKPVSAFQEAVSTWRRNGGDRLVGWYQDTILAKYGTNQ